MSIRNTPSPAARQVSPPSVFALLAVALVCALRAVLDDGDTYTHIAAGQWMLDHQMVLRSDPFSATFVGQPWEAHEWLSEVLLGVAHRVAGLTGVVLLTAAAVGVTFGNLARHIGRWCGWRETMLLTTAALMCVMPSILARPHVLALPLLEAWVAGLLIAREEHRPPSWWLLPSMAVWANLHGSFAFGIAVGGVFAAEASWERFDRRALRWWGFMAGACAAGLLTPQGWHGLSFPIRMLRFHSLSLIMEWQPVDFTRDVAFEGVLLAMVALLGSGLVKMPWWRLLLLVGLVHLSFAHVRHQVLFAIVGALIFAEPVGRAFAGSRWAAGRPIGQGVCWAGVGLTVLLRLVHPVGLADSPSTPVSAFAQLPPGMAGKPLLNSAVFGGFLTMAGLHPFIDGRVELFGDNFIFEANAMGRPDGRSLPRGIDRYGFEWAILTPNDPLVGRFEGMAGWRRQYNDEVAVVFVRG